MATLRDGLTERRVLLAVVICVLVSTRVFFQPLFDQTFSLELVLREWLDYFGECLLMGGSILLALAVAGILIAHVRGLAVPVLLAGAIVTGSIAGRLALISYYGLGWDDPFDRAFWGDVVFWAAIAGGAVTIYALQRRTTAASAALHEAQMDRLALSKQMLEARMQVMRAQIEPHFLFNTLANVKRLCQTDTVAGLAMLENLVHYLRAALPIMREAQTTLGQEADLVRAYLSVLEIRMGDRLRYCVDIPPVLRALPFPPMMLLTLAENAVKHGLNPSERGGTITIRARVARTILEVSVNDDGVGFEGSTTGGTGIGLANTRARLAALYGESARLDLEANVPAGVTATISIPLAAPAIPQVPALAPG